MDTDRASVFGCFRFISKSFSTCRWTSQVEVLVRFLGFASGVQKTWIRVCLRILYLRWLDSGYSSPVSLLKLGNNFPHFLHEGIPVVSRSKDRAEHLTAVVIIRFVFLERMQVYHPTPCVPLDSSRSNMVTSTARPLHCVLEHVASLSFSRRTTVIVMCSGLHRTPSTAMSPGAARYKLCRVSAP